MLADVLANCHRLSATKFSYSFYFLFHFVFFFTISHEMCYWNEDVS